MDHILALIGRAHQGDKEARDTLVEENIGLVWSIVKRFGNRGVEMEDLFQIGSIGLLKAIDKFDTSFDVKFSTYAVPMIAGEIKRFLRDDGMIKVSRSMKEISYKAYVTREELERSTGREPTLLEIANELQVTQEELVMAMEAGSQIESLQKTIYLEAQDRKLIYMRFFQERTQSEIAKEMGISQVQVSRMEKRILQSLRGKL